MGASSQRAFVEFAASFHAGLARLIDAWPERWLVAFSGGLDSTLLLHTLRHVDSTRNITAVHIDHGLHRWSGRWSSHCADVARDLGVNYVGVQVEVDCPAGDSLESVARAARYRALAEQVRAGDVVLTAHHADDQLETVLLRLLRGTGVRGLSAIHARAAFGRGLLVRPLLGFSRSELHRQARLLGLDWVEDPSNDDDRFDRNFLRGQLPRLLERWPAAGQLANRMAGHLLEAQQLLDELAAEDLSGMADPACLPVGALTELTPARCANLLRHAIRELDLPAPTSAQLAELRRQLDARTDATSLVTWPGGEARVYRNHLYLLAPAGPLEFEGGRIELERGVRLGAGELRLVAADGYGIPDQWAREGLTVAFRVGGERFCPRGSRHHKALKAWFQESGIVPWMRESVPLLYRDGQLVAVADLCLAAEMPQSDADGPFWLPLWTGHRRLR